MGVLCNRGIEFDVFRFIKDDVFVEIRSNPPYIRKKKELNSIYVEEVKSSLSNAFLQADLALAEDRNRSSFLRFFFQCLGSCCPYFWKVCLLASTKPIF